MFKIDDEDEDEDELEENKQLEKPPVEEEKVGEKKGSAVGDLD